MRTTPYFHYYKETVSGSVESNKQAALPLPYTPSPTVISNVAPCLSVCIIAVEIYYDRSLGESYQAWVSFGVHNSKCSVTVDVMT